MHNTKKQMKKFKHFMTKYIFKGIFWILIISIIVLIIQYFSHLSINNEETYKSIIHGIISGVVTALILFIFQILWKQNFLIWIENLLYQDVKIEGEWNGFVVPFIGLDELDKIQKDLAYRAYKRMRRENSLNNNNHSDKPNEKPKTTAATIYDSKTGKEEKVEAEIILNSEKDNENQSEAKTIQRTSITISATPIIIRAQFNRSGHKINGKILEIGGASDIHTYDINGSFKNLILTANYESTSDNHIDRGALSLMLIHNGDVLEGFFSSYSDSEHRMCPMKCYLTKKNFGTKNE